MKNIETWNDLISFSNTLSPAERAMPVQVGFSTGVVRAKSVGHCTDAADLGSNTLILETV